MFKTLLSLFVILTVTGSLIAEPQQLEPAQSYVYAQDRIAGFSSQSTTDEDWKLDPRPDGWTVMNLDGQWSMRLTRIGGFIDYARIAADYGVPDMAGMLKDANRDVSWKKTDVPMPLGLLTPASEESPGYVACYRKNVSVPSFDPEKQAVFLKFHAAGYRTDVWVNGHYVDANIGVFTPFAMDITAYVKSGQSADLLVKCVDSRYRMTWHDVFTSGITGCVELEIRSNPFADELSLVCNVDQGTLHGQFQLAGHRQSAQAQVTIRAAVSGKIVGQMQFKASRDSVNTFTIKLNDPRCWSPEYPFLYTCNIKLDDQDAAMSRFGFRTVQIKADKQGRQHFYLNGKRLYLRIFQFNAHWLPLKDHSLHPPIAPRWGANVNGWLRKEMLAMKFANVNAFRPHSMDQEIDETFLNLCDEMGFLVMFDWHGSEAQRATPFESSKASQQFRIPTLKATLPAFKKTIKGFTNHPSLTFMSFGNEFYDHLLDSESYDPVIEQYAQALDQVDPQQRPHCGSAGRPAYKFNAKVDYVDDHQYIGVYYGSYQSIDAYIKNTSASIFGKFGEHLPFINTETGYVCDDRIHPGNYRIYHPLLSRDTFDKNAFIKAITGKSPELDWARLALNSGGVRPYYTDLPTYKKRKATLLVKRYLELFRINHQLTDGVSLNTMPYSLAAYADPNVGSSDMQTPWPGRGKLVLMDPIYAFRQAFYPIQAFMTIDNTHLFRGDAPSAPIVLVNDSLADVTVDMVIQLHDTDGSVKPLLHKQDMAITQGGEIHVPFAGAIPLEGSSGKAVLACYLLQDGRKIAENAYDLYVTSPSDRISRFPERKVAVYDSADKIFAGLGNMTTRRILKKLKIPCKSISDFTTLDGYQVLVIGANSMDKMVSDNGSTIAQWIDNGGRLLMFEQSTTGAIPWSSDDGIRRMGAGSFMEIYFKKHPIFQGIEDEMAWEAPMDFNRELFDTCLDLNDSFLALAPVAHYQNPDSVKAIITNRRCGKGEMLLSMVKACDRFGKDATLTRYVENLMAYILGQTISPDAITTDQLTPSTNSNTMFLNKRDAYYIDLSKAVNRSFTDDVHGNGWTGFGSDSDLHNIQPGRNTIAGSVPFEILDPTINNGKGCIVLRGPNRSQFPMTSEPIAVNRRCKSLYFLHTAMWVNAEPGQSLLDYRITYADGTSLSVPMAYQSQIGDWWQAGDYDHARVVYREGDRCVFATRWVNSKPDQPIRSIQVVSRNKAIPIILAITAQCPDASRVKQIDRTELQDNRQ